MLPPREESHSATTFQYVVKRTKRKVPQEGSNNNKNSEVSEAMMKSATVTNTPDDKAIAMAALSEAAGPTARKVSSLVHNSDDANDKNNETMPQSPKGVDEFDSADPNSFTVEPFENFFDDDSNPFRVHLQAQITPITVSQYSSPVSKEHYSDDLRPTRGPDSLHMDATQPKDVRRSDIPSLLKKTEAPQQIGPSIPSSHDQPRPNYRVSFHASTASQNNYMHMKGLITPKMRLYIDDYDANFFIKLMDNLMGQPCIVKLDVHRGTNRKRTTSELSLLFQVVQSLVNLQTLHLTNIQMIDLDDLHDAIFGHRKLKRIQLRMMAGGIDDTVLRTLNTLPRLAEVSFETTESLDVSVLLRSSTIRKLHLSGVYTFSNAHVMAMVPHLECNTVLHELDFEPQISFLAFKFLAHTLRINRSIHVLQVNIEPTASHALVNQVMNEIATVLTLNSSLRAINNINHESLQPTMSSCRRILRALETNLTIEHFHLFREDSSFANRKKDVLKSDCHATSCGGYQDTKEADCSVDTTATTHVLCSAFEALDFEPIVNETRRILATAREKRDKALHFWFGGQKPRADKVTLSGQ